VSKKEMLKLLSLIKAFYPNREFNIDNIFDAWYVVLGKLPYEYAEKAIIKHATEDKYLPAISDIYKNAKEIYAQEKTNKELEKMNKFFEEKYGYIACSADKDYEDNILPLKRGQQISLKSIGNYRLLEENN
jgi:hypothetical protein